MIYYTRHGVLAIALAFSAAARAQTPPLQAAAPRAGATADAGAPAPSEPADPAAAPPPAAGLTPAEAARLDEIEQVARIAARKHELLEEEAIKRAKEAPRLSVDDGGFALTSADRSYVLKVRGQIQIDGRFFANNDTLQASDTFLVRRFRPSLDGTLFSFADFRFVPELAGTAQVLDAYVDLHPRAWLRLRAGKMKPPVGLERLQSDADLPLLERALDQNLSAQRDVGVQLWGDVAGGVVQYTIGIFNGAADTTAGDTDLNHGKDFEGRLFFQPFKAEGLHGSATLGLGWRRRRAIARGGCRPR